MNAVHLFLLLIVTSNGTAEESKKLKTDVDRIQGVWKFTESWDNGEHTDVSSTPVAIRFTRTEMEYGRLIRGKFQSEKKPFRFKFKLDPKRHPKHLDTKLGPRVYTLDGNVLRIVGFSSERKDRPKSEKDRPTKAPKKGGKGDGLWIGVFKRVPTQ